MRTKILTAFVAGGLLAGVGFLTAVISAPSTAQAQGEAGEGDAGRAPLPRIFAVLGDILDDLVGDGTITRDQADAIVEAAQDEAEELKEQRHERLEGARRHFRHHFRNGFRFGALLDDGGIDEDEYQSLHSDHMLKQIDVTEYLDNDGLITPEELREIFHELGESRFRDND